MFSNIIKIWENTDSFEEQYRCATLLYLLSILSHAYIITIDRIIGATGNGQEIFDVLNTTEKRFISMLMENLQLTGYKLYDD